MQYITLNNGVKMPILGLGVYDMPKEQMDEIIGHALKIGYRLIDTAQLYGNEAQVGSAIKKSGVPREEIFITTKIWPDKFNYAESKQAIQKSLDTLGVDYIDLLLIHQPFNDIYGVWKALQEAHANGIVKAIGVSNFVNDRILDLSLGSKITPAVNQVEISPLYQRAELIKFQQEMGVAIQSWSSFGRGDSGLLTNPLLVKIGKKYHKTAAQVILRWLIQQGVAVIPKSANPARLEQNFNVFDFQLSQGDIDEIASLDLKKTQFIDETSREFVENIYNQKY